MRPTLTRRQWAALPYTEDTRPFRALAIAALLKACTDAAAGDECAWAWMQGEQARQWAELAGLDQWPPRREQLGSRRELYQRAGTTPRWANDDDGTLGRIRSRNPADQGEAWGWDGDVEDETRPVLGWVERWERWGCELIG